MLSRFSHVSLCETLGLQPSRLLWRGEFIGFSTQVYWSGLLCPLLGDLPDPGMKPCLLHLLHWRSRSFPLVPPGSVYIFVSKSWFIPFPLSPLVTRSLFTLSVNLFLFYKHLSFAYLTGLSPQISAIFLLLPHVTQLSEQETKELSRYERGVVGLNPDLRLPTKSARSDGSSHLLRQAPLTAFPVIFSPFSPLCLQSPGWDFGGLFLVL